MVPQLDRASPLKERAGRGTLEGWSGDVSTLGHALCQSNSSCVTLAQAATPQVVGGLELFNGWGGRGYDDSVPGEVIKTAPSGGTTT